MAKDFLSDSEMEAFAGPKEFLSDEEMSKISPPVRERASPGASAMAGAVQGATFGLADEATAAIGGVKDYVQGKLGQRGDISLSDAYQSYLPHVRETYKKASEDNPVSYGTGELAGGLTTGLGGIGTAGKGVGMAGKLAAGGALGGLQAAGYTEAPVTSPQFYKDVGLGAGFGAVTPIAIEKTLGAAGSKLAPYLQKKAEERAVKAATGESAAAIRKLAKTTGKKVDLDRAEENIRKTGRELLTPDEDTGKPLLGRFDRPEEIAPKAEARRKQLGSKIGAIGDEIDKADPQAISGKSIADKMIDYAATIPETEVGRRQQERILAEAANFEKMGGFNFKDAKRIKSQFAYKPQDSDLLISNQDINNKINQIVEGEIKDTVSFYAKNPPPPIADVKRAKLKDQGYTFESRQVAKPQPGQDPLSLTQYEAFSPEGEMIGSVRFDPVKGGIKADTIKVDDIYQDRGVGSSLYKEAIDEARKKNPQAKIIPSEIQTEDGKEMWTAFRKGNRFDPVNTELLSEYPEINRRYGVAASIKDVAADRANKNLSNRYISPSDYGVGAAGAIIGSMSGGPGIGTAIGGAAAAAAHKIVRERGSAFMARSLQDLAQVAEKSPAFLEKYGRVLESAARQGERPFVVTHELMMKQDPEYRSYFQGGK